MTLFIKPKLETTQMSINREIHKKNLVEPYNGVLLSNKEKQLLIRETT